MCECLAALVEDAPDFDPTQEGSSKLDPGLMGKDHSGQLPEEHLCSQQQPVVLQVVVVGCCLHCVAILQS